jgi:exopolysaccharide production protein ExoY
MQQAISTLVRRTALVPASRDVGSRAVDLTVGFAILIFILPLLLGIALAIYVLDGRPIFFVQQRVGRDGAMFPCMKFRSMAVDADLQLQDLLARDATARAEWACAHKLRRDPRITPFGAFLRRSSFDELPQIFNVLLGDMSLVGPRPIVKAEILRYGSHFKSYCSVRPGITGLWQVSGRNDVSYRTRVAMDVVYAKKKNLRTDLWLILLTVPAVLFKRGAY